MKILFMGTPEFAVSTLEKLIEHHQVVAVVTQPDKKKGRGKKLQFSPVKEIALQNGIEVLQPNKIKAPEFVSKLKDYDADIFVVVAYGQILSEEILYMPKHGSVNVHASLLPKYRGAAPIQWAILDGEEKTGVTIMYMDKGLDTGDMILKKEIPILDTDNYTTLSEKLSVLGSEALIEALNQIESNTEKREKQDDSLSTYASMIKKEMGHIDFNYNTKKIINMLRGLNPWPSAYVHFNDEVIKFWEACEYESSKVGVPGSVLEVLPKKGFVIKTGDSSILVTEVQSSSGKRMSASNYMLGHSINVGDMFS